MVYEKRLKAIKSTRFSVCFQIPSSNQPTELCFRLFAMI